MLQLQRLLLQLDGLVLGGRGALLGLGDAVAQPLCVLTGLCGRTRRESSAETDGLTDRTLASFDL